MRFLKIIGTIAGVITCIICTLFAIAFTAGLVTELSKDDMFQIKDNLDEI